ncbi:hypothetical protein Dimus_015718 [Dionaea muscipula]
MELIEKTRDGKILFKKRLLVHVDDVKEFYAKMTVTHLKKKDVVKSEVRGVDLEFDNEKLATILGVPGKNGICEYIKEVWEESKYTKPLEITRRFANDATIMKAGRVRSVEMKPSRKVYSFSVIKKGEEPKKYDFFEDTFLTMCKLTREDGIWWIGSGENRRRDDDEAAPEEEAEGEDEGNQVDFDWEAVIDEATVEGESGSGEKFYDAEEEAQGSPKLLRRFERDATPGSARRRTRA